MPTVFYLENQLQLFAIEGHQQIRLIAYHSI